MSAKDIILTQVFPVLGVLMSVIQNLSGGFPNVVFVLGRSSHASLTRSNTTSLCAAMYGTYRRLKRYGVPAHKAVLRHVSRSLDLLSSNEKFETVMTLCVRL